MSKRLDGIETFLWRLHSHGKDRTFLWLDLLEFSKWKTDGVYERFHSLSSPLSIRVIKKIVVYLLWFFTLIESSRCSKTKQLPQRVMIPQNYHNRTCVQEYSTISGAYSTNYLIPASSGLIS